ncbi:MAG: DoxX family membrane protein, partial [Bacteroidota bacterium]|nr:DoxX family membrane protein [Bacteroidota bacterium]
MTKKSFYSSLFINSGRIIFALPFLGFGINHFIKTEKYVFFMPDYIPFPEYLMYFIGIVFILSAINIIINFKARISALVLAGILALLTIIVYLP